MKKEREFYMLCSMILVLGGVFAISASESYIGLSILCFGLGFIALAPKVSKSLNELVKHSYRLDYWAAYLLASFATFMLILFILSKI
jgi:hypothetical protein